jgi:hypothetical protein
MIPRRRGERTQKGNPHRLTREQHVIPVVRHLCCEELAEIGIHSEITVGGRDVSRRGFA